MVRVVSPWGRVLLSAFALCVLASCSSGKKSGGLVVVVDSDLAMPKDIDRIRLEITQSGRQLLSEDHPTGAGNMLIPVAFRIASPASPDPVSVRAIAYKQQQARIERSALLQIPRSANVVLRMPLNYLCDGTVTQDERSSCGDGQTCRQGACAVVQVADDELSPFDPGAAGAAGGGAAAPSGCFDTGACFTGAVAVQVDPTTCSFPIASSADPQRLNVGLKLPPGGQGVCDSQACWIWLDPGRDGWTLDNLQVRLPPAVCKAQSTPVVAISALCLGKPPGTPACGDWSSAMTRVDAATPYDPGAPNNLTPPVRVGSACEGSSTQACGDCGTRTRSCSAGLWSDWSECTTAALCSVAASQACGKAGHQICSAECLWGDCLGEVCEGSSARACGNCGTQHRVCTDGVWQEWSPCTGERTCKLGTPQSCDLAGTQACVAVCDWGDCGDANCMGAPSEPCGNCGTRSRACNTATGQWSEWGACSGEGECTPDASRVCGSGGIQSCGGDCRWDGACSGQTCSGSASRPCGACGIQTRSCDSGSATWSEWSLCSNERECTPSATRMCGASGTQLCGNDCQWETACAGQLCEGAPERTCGNCGVQTRTCDGVSATWSDWSECSKQGVCAPDDKRSCGAGGSQSCGKDCQWDAACSGQLCAGEASSGCGNCGMQTRSCDNASGAWSAWSACADQGACAPDATRSCGAGGTQTCTATCRWNTACSGQACSGSATQGCGNCGVQSRICDSDSAQWSSWSSCSSQGSCAPGATRRCGATMTGTQTCGSNCEWSSDCIGQTCIGSALQPCGNCGVQTRTCNTGNGAWSGWSACSSQGCTPDSVQSCGVGATGRQTCSALCTWGSCVVPCSPETRSCGNCGTQTRTCSADGTLSAWSTCTNQGVCAPGATGTCGTNGTQTCGAACTWGTCGCPVGQTSCAGRCVNVNSDAANCGSCNNACGAGLSCSAGRCVCPTGQINCSGRCVNTNVDAANCGVCGQLCAPGASCQNGTCGCPAGSESCGGTCTDTRSSPSNCGGCNRPCGAPLVCSNGICGCPNNQTMCVSGCKDTTRDISNCGACGTGCQEFFICVNSQCILDEGPPP